MKNDGHDVSQIFRSFFALSTKTLNNGFVGQFSVETGFEISASNFLATRTIDIIESSKTGNFRTQPPDGSLE